MTDANAVSTLGTEANRFELLVGAVVDYAIYMLDRDGFIRSWNRGAERFKGYKEPEILGEHFSRFYTDEDRSAGVPKRALETAANEGRFESEGWRVRKDGTRFWALVVIDPIRDQAGNLLGFAKVTRDLTDRKLAEEALRRSEEHFRILVQGVTDYAIYMLDPEGRITSWNSGARKIKGYDADEVVGDHFSRFYTPEDRQAREPWRALEVAARDGRFEKEGWRVRKDGSRFLAHVVIDAIRDEQGALVGFAKVTRDITDRKRMEAEVAQSSKMATLGTLAAGIAHELNQPLNVIRMWAENGLRNVRSNSPDLARVERTFELAIQQTQRMGAIITHMRTLSRADPGKMDYFDPAQSARAAVELVEHQYAGSGIAVELDAPEGMCESMAALFSLSR